MNRPKYEQAIAKAGTVLATGRRTAEQMSPAASERLMLKLSTMGIPVPSISER